MTDTDAQIKGGRRFANQYRTVAWPEKPTGKCLEAFATVVNTSDHQIFLGAPSLDALEAAWERVMKTEGLTVSLDRDRVQHIVMAILP
jgi:hypothetical protein